MLPILFSAIFMLWSLLGFFTSRVEQAQYKLIQKRDGYEIREYPPHLVAQTIVSGNYTQSINDGFRRVANYIFGGNTRKESIAMTAPVFVEGMDGDARWDTKKNNSKQSIKKKSIKDNVSKQEGGEGTLSFIMPRSYKLETLPHPNDARVKIIKVPVKKYAVRRFSWYRTEARIARETEKIQLALSRDGARTSSKNVIYAGYNPPWTPPWMTRHEIFIEITTQ